MKFLILLLILCESAHAVVGGRDLMKHEYPEVVDFEVYLGNQLHQYCTASIIGPSLLLTAAHCVFNYQEAILAHQPAEIILPPGISVKEVFISPRYQELKRSAQSGEGTALFLTSMDIALIQLNGAFSLQGLPMSQPHPGAAQVIGFGGKIPYSSSMLNQKNDETLGVKRMGNVKIEKIYAYGRIDSARWPKKQEALSVRGDSGGPVLQNGAIVGVIVGNNTSDQTATRMNSSNAYFTSLDSSAFYEIFNQYKNKQPKR